MRIAIASRDGKIVNEHFGRTEAFYIADVDDIGIRWIETRVVSPLCTGGEHQEETLQFFISLLSDCHAVVVSRIGKTVAYELKEKGIQPYELPLPVEEAVLRVYTNRNEAGNHE